MAYPTDAEFEELVETLHGQMRALGVPSLVPAAILILRLKGKPYSLAHHYMFEPLFRVDPSPRTILKSARQVGKSQNLAASRLLKNIFMPYYNTLFVCPRFEQVKRISNLYMKPLINESLYKDLFVNPETCEQSILQRSFTSGSVQFFSFALLDAERIRSISASEVAIDESVVGTTEIAPGKCIVDLKAGDVIDSFTDEGYVTKSVVNKAPSYHGRRRCFKVTSKSGAWVDGTMDHLISTSRGWLRIGEIIDYVLDEYRTSLHTERVPVYNRITTGGSQSESSIRNISSAEEHPLSDTARIQPGKIPDIERVYKASTKDSREQGLREAVLSLVFPITTDLALFVRPGIPGREEDSDFRLAGEVDTRGFAVVVSGRRIPTRGETDQHIDTRLYKRMRGYTSQVPDNKMGYTRSNHDCSEEISCAESLCRSIQEVPCFAPTRSGQHVLQDSMAEQVMPKLRDRDIGAVEKTDVRCRMPQGTSEKNENGLRRKERGQRKEEQSSEKTIQGRYCHEQRKAKGVRQPAQSEDTPRDKACCLCGAMGRNEEQQGIPSTESSVVEGILRKTPCRHGEVGREKTSIQAEEKGTQVIGSGVCGTGESTDASVAGTPERLELDPIVKIEYTGWQDVYDIEVVGTQTYFANGVASHNCQDINWDFIPIIAETLSGQEKWRYQTFTGTPKTIENTIERLWSDSSMAEWATKCEHCNKWNIACLEQDALMMLGDTTVVCAKCRRPIDPGTGLWLHKYPTKIEDFRGYHIPQIVHPYHWKNPKFWKDLLYKMRTYPYPKFVNECLGESFDSATKLMTIETLRKIERKEFINDLKTAAKISKDYKFIAMGIDWGGGGSDSKSFTSISIVGLRTGSDVLDTIYLKILPQSMDPTKEITEILHLVQVFNPAKIGHDYGGAGYLREVLLIHAGISPDRIMPFTYVVSPSKQVITYNPGVKGTRTSYSIDRSRSIITLCAMMKAGKVRTPNYESFKHELADFLVIFEDRQERLRSSDLVLIDKVAGAADDTVHSLNYACSTIWYYHQKYPNLAEANEIRLSKEEIARIAPKNITVDDWLQQ